MENQKKKLISFNDFVSGSIAGIANVLLGQPFDIVKVRMQTMGGSTSAFECTKSILVNEGPMAFYKGTLSPLIGISFCVAIQFGANEFAKNYLREKNRRSRGDSTLSIADFVVSGIFAGIANSFAISPVELIRIKMQVIGGKENGSSINYNSTVDCARKIYSEYGIKGLFQGYSSTLFREIPAYAVYFGVYESLMSFFENKYKRRKDIPITIILSCGAVSGLLLWIATFPNDVIKSRMQADNISNRKYPTIMSTINSIYSESGVKGFFKGLTPCLMRAPIVNGATFLTFELVQNILNKNKNH